MPCSSCGGSSTRSLGQRAGGRRRGRTRSRARASTSSHRVRLFALLPVRMTDAAPRSLRRGVLPADGRGSPRRTRCVPLCLVRSRQLLADKATHRLYDSLLRPPRSLARYRGARRGEERVQVVHQPRASRRLASIHSFGKAFSREDPSTVHARRVHRAAAREPQRAHQRPQRQPPDVHWPQPLPREGRPRLARPRSRPHQGRALHGAHSRRERARQRHVLPPGRARFGHGGGRRRRPRGQAHGLLPLPQGARTRCREVHEGRRRGRSRVPPRRHRRRGRVRRSSPSSLGAHRLTHLHGSMAGSARPRSSADSRRRARTTQLAPSSSASTAAEAPSSIRTRSGERCATCEKSTARRSLPALATRARAEGTGCRRVRSLPPSLGLHARYCS